MCENYQKEKHLKELEGIISTTYIGPGIVPILLIKLLNLINYKELVEYLEGCCLWVKNN